MIDCLALVIRKHVIGKSMLCDMLQGREKISNDSRPSPPGYCE